MGTEKQSIASKKQWLKLSIKKRRARTIDASIARWKNITQKERSEHAKKMALARWGNK